MYIISYYIYTCKNHLVCIYIYIYIYLYIQYCTWIRFQGWYPVLLQDGKDLSFAQVKWSEVYIRCFRTSRVLMFTRNMGYTGYKPCFFYHHRAHSPIAKLMLSQPPGDSLWPNFPVSSKGSNLLKSIEQVTTKIRSFWCTKIRHPPGILLHLSPMLCRTLWVFTTSTFSNVHIVAFFLHFIVGHHEIYNPIWNNNMFHGLYQFISHEFSRCIPAQWNSHGLPLKWP